MYWILFFIIFHLVNSKCYPKMGSIKANCLSSSNCMYSKGLVCGDGRCGLTCPENWIQNDDDDSCYFVHTDKLTHEEAENYCKNYHAKLVSIKTLEKKIIIANLMINHTINNTWLSATLFSLNNFQWEDQSDVEKFWCNGEPNNMKRVGDINIITQNCTKFNLGTNDSCIDDVKCTRSEPFICEIELKECIDMKCACLPNMYWNKTDCVQFKDFKNSCNDDDCDYYLGLNCVDNICQCDEYNSWSYDFNRCVSCPEGWFYHEGKCYKFFQKNKNMTFYEAIDECKNEKNSSLIKMIDKNAFELLKTFLLTFSRHNNIWVNANFENDKWNVTEGKAMRCDKTINTQNDCYLGKTSSDELCFEFFKCSLAVTNSFICERQNNYAD